ncbi:MAG: DUF1206 domain-containing protein, partial [Actinomycetota bacterium]|nr:DUF1206 domain-containing protein [Actinomycetota bacterium]
MDTEGARASGERAGRAAAPWVEAVGRLGWVAKGVLYVVMGLLAVQIALGGGGGGGGEGGERADQQGAL